MSNKKPHVGPESKRFSPLKPPKHLQGALADIRIATNEGPDSNRTLDRPLLKCRPSSADLQMLIKSLPESLIVERDETILFANPALMKLIGAQTETEVIGRRMAEIIQASFLEKIRLQVAKDNESGVASLPREIVVLRSDGSAAPAECIGSSIIWGGQPAILVVIRDIAGRKRSHQVVGVQKPIELTDRAARLDRNRRNGQAATVPADATSSKNDTGIFEAFADDIQGKISENRFLQAQKMEAFGRLAGSIAHDFNNVLMVSSSYAELILQTAGVDARVLNYAEQIKRATARATIVIRQLLALSRQQTLEPENLNFRDVVSDLSRVLPNIMGQNIEVVASTEEVPPVLADRGQAEQVIMNLALNARDAMPKGGRLTIDTRAVSVDASLAATMPPLKPGNYVCLSVSDNGTGMNEQTKQRIFEPFFTTKERGKGTGLGLAAVYGIVKQCRGFVFVESEIGEGTKFKIYFPATANLAEQKRQGELEFVMKGRGETILIVEDEPQLREAIVQYLQSSGYSVLSAASAGDATRLATESKSRVAVVVADLVLPGVDGSEVVRQLRFMYSEILALFMSGYSDRAVEELGPGAVFLRKPFDLAELALRVRELLDSRPEPVNFLMTGSS